MLEYSLEVMISLAEKNVISLLLCYFTEWREIWLFLAHKERVFSEGILICECNAATQMKGKKDGTVD